MLWIGLTGGIASGKSTVSQLLRSQGYSVVDADELVRELYQAGSSAYSEMLQAFGQEISDANGILNRQKIADLVFRDKAKLKVLEDILHPRVRELALKKKAELERAGKAFAFYDVPLLFEKNMESFFDQIVVIACSRELQLQRLMTRNGFSSEEAERRIQAQIPIEEKVRRGNYVINNERSFENLQQELEVYLNELKSKI